MVCHEGDLLSCLSADEKDRYHHMSRPHLRRDFLISRAALRLLLSSYSKCSAASLKFQYNAYGKPFLQGNSLFFNVSHSGSFIIYAFSARAELGIDIEKVDPASANLSMAEICFSDKEIFLLKCSKKADFSEIFFKTWSRKEAYVKALGMGFSLPLKSFSVDADSVTQKFIEADLSLMELSLLSDYKVAICQRGQENLKVRVREVSSSFDQYIQALTN